MDRNTITLKSCVFLLLTFVFLYYPIHRSEAQDCEVISYKSHFRIERNKLYESETILLQVNNRMGEHYTEFAYPYNSKYKITSLNAQIEDMFGKAIRKLKKDEITDVNAASDIRLYSDDFYKIFWLKHNKYPYRVRVTCENVSNEFYQITHWFPIKSYRIPTRKAELKLEVPTDYIINYRNNIVGEPLISSEPGIRIYEWNTSYTEIIEKEKYMPPLEVLLPHVVIVPVTFNYGAVGSYTDWKSFGQWAYLLKKDRGLLTNNEKAKVTQITQDLETDYDKAKALFYYLQDNTRYINISIDIGGFQPHTAEYVCNNKYGDCKALVNYMQSLLNEVDIKSYYSLVYTDLKNIPINLEFPEQHFNHVILQIPLKEDTIWLDCTNNTSPFGYIHSGIQNRYALVIDNQQSHLVKIPEWTADSNTTERNIEIIIDPAGNTKMNIDITAKGTFAENLRSFKSVLTENDKKQTITEYFSFSSFDLLEWKLSEISRDSAQIKFYSELMLNNYVKNYGSDNIVKIIHAKVPDFEPPSRRSLPVQIDVPIASKDSIVIEFPVILSLSQLPENESITSRFGSYQINYQSGENNIQITRDFTINSGRYSLKEYSEFYDFISSLLHIENGNVIVLQNK